MGRRCAVVLLLGSLAAIGAGQNCSATATGATPLNDLGSGTYLGATGGLYPGGFNVPPPGHASAATAAAATIVPRDGAGVPDPSGRTVLLSIGMSNTTLEFRLLVEMSIADPNRHPAVVLVDGAQGGQDISAISNPAALFWQNITQRLLQKNVTPNQVQAIWFKEALAQPSGGFPASAVSLKNQFKAVMGILKQKYPNLAIVYLASRIYAGYATTTLNPEPYAYECGFAVKWLIEDQINGDPTLNHDPTQGPVRSALLLWGPYFWADGLTPRSDGLIWECSDFAADGTHPGLRGRQKVANMLNGYFTTSPFATPWYVGVGPGVAALQVYGNGCTGSNGSVPHIQTNSSPTLGNGSFNVGVTSGVSGAQAILFASRRPGMMTIVEPCVAWISLDPADLLFPVPTNPSSLVLSPSGSGFFSFQIPPDPSLAGLDLYGQWAVLDGATASGFSLSRALRITIGP